MDLTFKINQIKTLTIKSYSNLYIIKGKSWLDNSDTDIQKHKNYYNFKKGTTVKVI